jgi:hypothetical protein
MSALGKPDPDRHSFILKIGKDLLEARANGWGIAGIVAFAFVIGVAYLAVVRH